MTKVQWHRTTFRSQRAHAYVLTDVDSLVGHVDSACGFGVDAMLVVACEPDPGVPVDQCRVCRKMLRQAGIGLEEASQTLDNA